MTSLAAASAHDTSTTISLLREAAAGQVPERDLEYAQNRVKWATNWSRTLIEAGAGAALGGLRSDRMAAQFDRLSATAPARGTPFGPAASEAMAAMVKARSAAGM